MSIVGYFDADDVPNHWVLISDSEWNELVAGSVATHANGSWHSVWLNAFTVGGRGVELTLVVFECRVVLSAAMERDGEPYRYYDGVNGYKLALELIS
jgi:hypothetical protein